VRMCHVFRVSPSGYYAYRDRPESARAKEDDQLAEEVHEAFKRGRRHYGSPRVVEALGRKGRHVSKRRVARLMREQGLRATAPKRRWVTTTDSRHDHPIAENLIDRDFTAPEPNQKWAGDITYIPTSEGWLYLAVFLDLFSRRVIGWSMSDRLDAELAVSALRMALRARQPTQALIVHSDRGVQYAAGDFRQMLSDWSLQPSMSRKGNCYDNAVSESFFATLKKELVHDEHYRSRDEARASIFDYIEVFYNRERLHSTIGYCSPAEYELLWNQVKSNESTLAAAA
jgi:putative transposase